MADDKSQRTEKPTPKKLRQAKEDGKVARSGDVTAWLTVLSAAVIVPGAVRSLRSLVDRLLIEIGAVAADPEPSRALHALHVAGSGVVPVLAPMLAASVVIAIVGGVAQGGIYLSPKRFRLKFDKLNVAKGIKNMLGPQAAWNLAKALVKLTGLSLVAWLVLKGIAAKYAGSSAWSLSTVVAGTGSGALSLIRATATVGLVVAAADYLVERRRVAKSLMMSRDEIKRESRQSEGDPLVKSTMRARQREMSRNRMMAAVATADVVVVNPIHVAVALRYEPGSGAPRVVAKGAGTIAARIREEAEKHRLPMVEDVPLARTLYRVCEVGDEIPADLYAAVARVLAFVMALRRRGGSVAGLHRAPALVGSA